LDLSSELLQIEKSPNNENVSEENFKQKYIEFENQNMTIQNEFDSLSITYGGIKHNNLYLTEDIKSLEKQRTTRKLQKENELNKTREKRMMLHENYNGKKLNVADPRSNTILEAAQRDLEVTRKECDRKENDAHTAYIEYLVYLDSYHQACLKEMQSLSKTTKLVLEMT